MPDTNLYAKNLFEDFMQNGGRDVPRLYSNGPGQREYLFTEDQVHRLINAVIGHAQLSTIGCITSGIGTAIHQAIEDMERRRIEGEA